MATVITGLESLTASPEKRLREKKLGLLCNPASVDSRFTHAKDRIHGCFPGHLTALFSPQHGFFAEKQDNMIESPDLVDPRLGIPIYSLYGPTRIPTTEMLEGIDVLLVDLQDVGTRVYTFAATLSYCLEAAARMNKEVMVLDRPNPINGVQIEGNCLASGFESFVGRYPIPMRHGLTLGEYALYINEVYDIKCRLKVVPMKGWRRSMYFQDTGLPWVFPSPNLPSPGSALVYPGQVIWEGTNVSEGRGTTLPFEIFGAPFIDPDKILAFMGGRYIPGGVLRPILFEPTFNKWMGRACRGFQIHVTDPYAYKPYATSLRLLQAVLYHHRNDFAFKPPPYEYETEKLPLDLIIGDGRLRQRIERMEDIDTLENDWADQQAAFISASRKYHLYQE